MELQQLFIIPTLLREKPIILLEQNDISYFTKEDSGGLRLIGGARDFVNGRLEGSLEALAKEFYEEFKSPVARDILIESLYESGEKYTTLENTVNGDIAYTDIYLLKLNKKEWEPVEKSGSTKGTGIFRAFNGELTLNIPNGYFAFNSAGLIKGFVFENSYLRKNTFLN